MSLQLYSASAGSGKTYTLTIEYIKLALQEVESRGYFRRILAVTFTTKAAEEMRSRIIEFLHGIASIKTSEAEAQAEFQAIIDIIQVDYRLRQIHISDDELIRRAQFTEQQLLQDYGLFSVMTIDSFVQRLSSTFIEELNLPSQFEVLLDSNQLMDNLLDQLLDKVNRQGDPIITKLIIDFAKSEVGEGRSWNQLRKKLHDFLKICLNEDYYVVKKEMDSLRITDFLEIERQIAVSMDTINAQLITLASQFVFTLSEAGIQGDMLAYGKNSCAGYFAKIVASGYFEEHKLTYLRASLISGIWTSKGQEPSIVTQINAIGIRLSEIGNEFVVLYDSAVSRYFLFKLIKKDLKKIALLASITDELHQYQHDRSAVSISEFSKRLYDVIANDPVPFIYEKLGDRYNHILIDEFQDTSILQWQNFMPLLEHAVSQGNKSLLVGDAKQSIYKFRGGEVGLISSLKSDNNTFIEHKLVDKPIDLERFRYLKGQRKSNSLDSNFRSAKEIVQFNNAFFTWIAANPIYQIESSLVLPTYGTDLIQNPKVSDEKFTGKVDVFVFNKPAVENHAEIEMEWMLARVLELINHEKSNGFQYKDIAILTRKNNQAKFLAIQLKERNIPVISSDSLLVHYANVVGFIISFMRLKMHSNDVFRFNELIFQYADLCQENLDTNLITRANANNIDFYRVAINHFETLGFNFNDDESHLVSWVYGLVSTFNLTQHSSEIEYLFKFLDIVNEYVLIQSDDFDSFLTFYDANKASFSIASPEGDNAITITSIHRSKGLEYPVVICPFVSWTHQPNSEQLWFDLKPLAFEELRLSEQKSLHYYYGKVVPKELGNFESLCRQQKDEFDAVFLDALNMLYVAFTRPKQHLHILLGCPNDKAHATTKRFFNQSLGELVLQYCLSDVQFLRSCPTFVFSPESCQYFLINESSSFKKYDEKSNLLIQKNFVLSTQTNSSVDFRIQTNQEDLYTSAQSKRERGELVHEMLAKIPDYLFYELEKERFTKQYGPDAIDLLDQLLQDSKIKSFFKPDEFLFSERDILCPDGDIIRPDRVIQTNDITLIIDFKTGKKNAQYVSQLEKYKQAISLLGYRQVNAVLVYIETQTVEEV